MQEYQVFADRDALVAAAVERIVEALTQAINERGRALMRSPVAAARNRSTGHLLKETCPGRRSVWHWLMSVGSNPATVPAMKALFDAIY